LTSHHACRPGQCKAARAIQQVNSNINHHRRG
jgi:hypothetical protein